MKSENMKDICAYMRQFAPDLGERILKRFPALHQFCDPVSTRVATLLRTPFPAQSVAIMGVVKRWQIAPTALVLAECEAGKTLISLGRCMCRAKGAAVHRCRHGAALKAGETGRAGGDHASENRGNRSRSLGLPDYHLTREHQKLFPVTPNVSQLTNEIVEAPTTLNLQSEPSRLIEDAISTDLVLVFGQRPEALRSRRRQRAAIPEQSSLFGLAP